MRGKIEQIVMEVTMRVFLIVLFAFALLVAGCDIAKDTTETAEEGGKGATGLAEKMKGGTVGDANADTGETADEQAGE